MPAVAWVRCRLWQRNQPNKLSACSLLSTVAVYHAFSDRQYNCLWICTVKWLRKVTYLWRTKTKQNLKPVPNRKKGKWKWLDDSEAKEKLSYSVSLRANDSASASLNFSVFPLPASVLRQKILLLFQLWQYI